MAAMGSVCRGLLAAALCAATIAAQAPDTPEAPEGWTAREVRGFRVVVKDAFRENPLHDRVLELIDHQLYKVTRAIPAPALARLRKITVWVGDEDPRQKQKCMYYHPSPRWLKDHDYPEFFAKGIEVANAKNFLSWTKAQPWMVLHELAHGYHHQVVTYGNAKLRARFQGMKKSGTYEKVLRVGGRTERHYALTNVQEYFAESTEAYFGTNDFYPFVRGELKQHDPEMFALLRELWGK